ncbi:MAG: purine nucleoside permease, partial [Gammaproteobacteria bacterium]
MALGNDPRFDLSNAYWLIAGIAGADPEDASLASAAWAEYVVDGDLIHEIEGREIPEDWPYGKMTLSGTRPNERKPHSTDEVVVFKLQPSLVQWAYELTKDTPIPDGPEITAFRQQFDGYPNAVKAPFVLIGDAMGSSTYWHGDIFNRWANDWVKLYSEDQGNFVMTAMEDNGTATALLRLDRAGRVDSNRLLVLRTASNYSTPPPGESASWHISADYVLGGRPAIESAYQVGSRVLDEILANWKTYKDELPGS